MIDSAAALVRFHEGCILEAKPDAKGKWVIGIGHDIPPSPGLACTQAAAEAWFTADMEVACRWAIVAVGADCWLHLDPVRRAALVDMAFNLGCGGLEAFGKMLTAITEGDWTEAEYQALNSQWARQVPDRARMDAAMLATGEWPVAN